MMRSTTGASVPQIARETPLPEWPLERRQDRDLMELVANRMGLPASRVRTAIQEAGEIGDPDGADLFTGVSRGLDKDLWLVEPLFE